MLNYVMFHNTFILAKLVELFPIKLHIIIRSKVLDLFSYLLLNHNFSLFKYLKDIIFMPKNIHLVISKVVIKRSIYIFQMMQLGKDPQRSKCM